MRLPGDAEMPVVGGTLDLLIQASDEPDQMRKQNMLRAAQVLATESLRDAIKECTVMLKEVANRQIDSTLDLDRTVQTATNAVVSEVRKATLREVA